MGRYYDEARTKLELELDRANAENTEHYIRMLENRVHEYLAVREELLTFRDCVADAVQANGLCNQGILNKVKELFQTKLTAAGTPIPAGTDLSTLPTPGTYVCRSTICRAVTLLTAAKERLEIEAAHCDDAMPVTTHYDDADCDGYCLLEDIKSLLDEFKDGGIQPGME